jgi:hypothetical protein
MFVFQILLISPNKFVEMKLSGLEPWDPVI